MRIIAVAVASVFLCHAPGSAAAQPANAESIVQVGVFGYRADGSGAGAAYDTEPSLDSRVYASRTLCQVGAGYRDAPAWAMHAWRFSGRVVSKTADSAVVQLTWQRTLDSGSEVALPEHVVQLTLQRGEPVMLDTVPGAADSPCSLNVSFEARYMPRFSDRRGSARVADVEGSLARARDGTGVAGPSVRTGESGLSAGQTPDRGTLMDVDLWLVHTAPDRKDEVIHQRVRSPQEGADFGFAPLSILTPQGRVIVQVNGSFGVADGQLTFVTNRSVKYAFQSVSGPIPDAQGTGRTVTLLPTAREVLSFEMPPIAASPGRAPLPNQLEVRIRIAR